MKTGIVKRRNPVRFWEKPIKQSKLNATGAIRGAYVVHGRWFVELDQQDRFIVKVSKLRRSLTCIGVGVPVGNRSRGERREVEAKCLMGDDRLVVEEPSGNEKGALWFKKFTDALGGVGGSGAISKEASLVKNARGVVVLANAGEPVGGGKRG